MMAWPESVCEVRVRYAETDQMGVAYHTNYLVWCEIGRTELMRELGMPYAALEQAGVFLAVAETHVRFMAAARYDERIRIRTRLERLQSRAVTFVYELSRDGPEGPVRVASASTKLIAMDGNGAARTLPDAFLDAIRKLRSVVP
jgi:acyl-CoA thioester hydrolase